MSRRQFVNDPDQVVPEALEGLVLAHPGLLRLHPDPAYVTRAVPATGKVGLVSGGGSGHEPLHAGFVGTGMLDVAVAGAVFASPTALQIRGRRRPPPTPGAGVLQIVKNYTGDVLNFQIARRDRRRRRHRRRARCSSTTTWPPDAPTAKGPAGAAPRRSSRSRRSAAPRPRPAPTWPTLAALGRRVVGDVPEHGPRPGRRRAPRRRTAGVRAARRPGRARRRHPRRARRRPARRSAAPTSSSTSWSTRSSPRSAWAAGDAVLAIVNGLGAHVPARARIWSAGAVRRHLGGARHRRRPQPGRLVRHLAGHGRAVRHPRPRRRRAARGSGTPPSARPR